MKTGSEGKVGDSVILHAVKELGFGSVSESGLVLVFFSLCLSSD